MPLLHSVGVFCRSKHVGALAFAGGMSFKGPWGEVSSANITPDPSGISYYDEALFLKTMRTGHVGARPLKSIMPWGYFRNMTDDDLKAIFAVARCALVQWSARRR